ARLLLASARRAAERGLGSTGCGFGLCQPRLAPTEAGAWFRDDAGGRSLHRSTFKTIRRNMRAIAVIGIALLLNPILDLGENTAWR
ncbi:hypothetical protein ACNZ8H_004360, partial [Stenotrophomonas maltophilia]